MRLKFEREIFFVKRIILILSIILIMSGCSSEKNGESSVNSDYTPAEIPQEISVQKDTGEILEKTFVELWKSETVYIEADMTVEGMEKTGEKQVYKYRTAVDGKNKNAMLYMEEPDGKKVHYIINDGKIYDIDNSEKKYSVSEYENTVDSFLKAYTIDMNMGMTEPLKIADTGITEFDGQELEFEKYNVKVADGSDENITVTYYFKDGKPYAEVMQSDRGKTSFLFREVSDSIKDSNIFKVSKDYSER